MAAVCADLLACSECTEIPTGLSHLWTTPILRHQLVDGQHDDLLTTMERLVLRNFRTFQDTCDDLEEDETENDRFFTMQREAFERGDPSFLEEGDDSEMEAFATLRHAWLENAREYLGTAASEDAAAAVFDADDIDVFCWASVHEGNSVHVPHTHPSSAVSGVFYVSVPPGVGSIAFEDPRAAHSPIFAVNQRTHTPVAGELLLFPPWVIHLVGSSSDAPAPRISISFNLYCTHSEDADTEVEDALVANGDDGVDEDVDGDDAGDDPFEGNADWRVLADTEVALASS